MFGWRDSPLCLHHPKMTPDEAALPLLLKRLGNSGIIKLTKDKERLDELHEKELRQTKIDSDEETFRKEKEQADSWLTQRLPSLFIKISIIATSFYAA